MISTKRYTLSFERVADSSKNPNRMAVEVIENDGFTKPKGTWFITEDDLSMNYIIYYTPTKHDILFKKFI